MFINTNQLCEVVSLSYSVPEDVSSVLISPIFILVKMDTVCFNPGNNVTFCAHNLHKLSNLGTVAADNYQYSLYCELHTFYVELVTVIMIRIILVCLPQSAAWTQNAFGHIQ